MEPASDDDEEEQSGSDAGSDSDVALSGSDAEAGICRWAEGGKEGFEQERWDDRVLHRSIHMVAAQPLQLLSCCADW